MMWLLKTLFGFLPGLSQWLDAREQTKQAEIAARAGVASTAISASGSAVVAQQESARAYAAAGMGWAVLIVLLPAFVAGMAAALHFAAVAFVSAVPAVGYTIHALPGPMAEWQGVILTTIVGGGGLLLGGLMFRR